MKKFKYLLITTLKQIWKSKLFIGMRATLLILIVSISQVIAVNSFAENIRLSFNVKNTTIKTILNEIEDQSEFYFIYDATAVDVGKEVSIKLEKKLVPEILVELFKGTNIKYKINGHQIAISKSSANINSKQPKSISGKVTNSSGELLPGVTVIIKGTTKGTVTDVDGKYLITEVLENTTLIFSFVGMEAQEVNIGIQTFINVQLLESEQNLDEIVVTALGIKRLEKSLGYSIQQIDSKAFEKIKTDNPINQLNGKVAGLTINSKAGILESPSVKLRGRSPIYVVNGTPVNNYRGISSDDIESISILKGAQSAILYGSRGTDGAILITTKSGGKNTDKVNVTVNSSTMLTAGYLTIPKQQSEFGTGLYGLYSYKDGKGGGVMDGLWSWGPRLDQMDGTTASGYWETVQYNSPIDAETGERIPIPWRSYENNLKNFMQQGIITDNNVSVAKKYKDGSMRMAFNQMYRKGQMPNTDLKRFGFNMTGNYNITSKLHVNANMLYSYLYTHNQPTSTYGNQHPYYNLAVYMGPNNDINDLKNYWEEGQNGYAQRNWNHSWFNNPWFAAYEYQRPITEPEFIGSFSLDYDFSKDLNLMVKGATNSKSTYNKIQKPVAWVNGVKGEYSRTNNGINTFDLDAMLSYKKVLGNFNIDAMLGGAWYEYKRDYFNAYTVDGLQLPNLYNLSNSVAAPISRETLTRKRTYGAYGTATFGYKNALYLTVAGRNDWSSALRKESRSYFYPSVSFSGIVSELVEMPDIVSFCKVRASWAKVGRDMASYNLADAYTLSGYWDGNPSYRPGSILISETNPVEPSFTSSFEIGTDIRFMKNRIRFDFSYFNTLDAGWIQQVDVNPSSGYSKMLVNGNDYRRTGYEVVLGVEPIKTKDWKWDVNLNWFTNKIVLEEIYNGEYNYGSLKKGDRADSYYRRIWQRDPDGNFVIDPNTGRPIEDPYVRCVGNTGADWEFGISSSLNYKKFTITADISGRIGGVISSDLNARMIQAGTHMKTAVMEREEDWDQIPSYIPSNAVTVTGGEISYDNHGNILSDTRTFAASTTPVYYKYWMDILGYLGGPQTFGYSLYEASFVKFRNISISYDFTDFIKRQKIIKELEISLIGTNLLIWKKLDNEDPDASFSESNAFSYPTERLIGLNLKLTL